MGTKSVSIHTFALTFLLCIAAGSASAQSGATTPDALVDGLLQSIEERNLVNYDLALDSEFTFHFAPEDVDRVPGGNLVTIVSNQHEFFVVQRDTDWQLFAWREMNPVLKILNESSTWGAVKLGYADVVIANENPGWSELKSLW